MSTARWAVPESFAQHLLTPEDRHWADGLPATVAAAASELRLAPDGEPVHGWQGVLWPAVTLGGRPVVLKAQRPGHGEAESAALQGAPGSMVGVVDRREGQGILVLDRLDATRDLTDEAIDAACQEIGRLVAEISGVPAVPGLVPMREVVAGLVRSTTREHARRPGVLDDRLVDRALATWADLDSELAAASGHRLLHGDLHFLNVLHTLPGEPSRWVAIDPTGVAGRPEWEVVPALRNRWPDAAATGDPDRALRRRLDQICEQGGLDRSLARRISQAVAVDNLLWLLDEQPDHFFTAPYRVVAAWTD